MKTDLVEDAHTEFKEEYTNKIIKAAVAFSNTSGGRILVGIKDNGDIVGVDDQDTVSNQVISGLSDNVRPSIVGNFGTQTIRVDDKDIIEVQISEGSNKPYYWKEKGLKEGGVFIRNGPTNIPVPEAEILKMIRDYPIIPYEELPSRIQDLTFKETKRIFEINGVGLDENNMVSLGIKSEGRFTNLGYLLSDQCRFDIKAAMFDDAYMSNFQDREEMSGSVLYQLERALKFVDNHNNRRSKIEGVKRIDSRDYPENSVREAIVNAIVHRDYAVSGSILIEMYPERMVVSSIGGINKGLALDDILLGTSSRRNERLVSIFYRLGLMEAYGTGIPRIMGSYRNQLVKPKIELSTNIFKITLPKTLDIAVTEDMMAIMDCLRSGRKGRSVIEMETGIPRMRLLDSLNGMEAQGLIKKIGSGRAIVYEIDKKYV